MEINKEIKCLSCIHDEICVYNDNYLYLCDKISKDITSLLNRIELRNDNLKTEFLKCFTLECRYYVKKY